MGPPRKVKNNRQRYTRQVQMKRSDSKSKQKASKRMSKVILWFKKKKIDSAVELKLF